VSYRRTIKRYPRILALPIVLAVVLAVWSVLGSPKAYEATASLWVDHPAPAPSSLTETDPSLQPPAQQEQLILQELLKTRAFRLAVGHRGPLADFLENNRSSGWGPTALLSKLAGDQSLDFRVAGALSDKKLSSLVAGPQVLQVSYHGPTPEVAAATLQALIDELSSQVTRIGAARDKASIAFYQQQVDAASKALAESRAKVQSYPNPTPADPHYVALVRAQRAAGRELASATAKRNQAASEGTGAATASTAFHLLDAPRLPAGPVSGKKKLIMALFGGAFAGALISLLALIALTPSKPSSWDVPADPWAAPAELWDAPADPWDLPRTPAPADPRMDGA
jgi:uncharacterized protein involved in exopolysaccharide biosynthesis